MMSKKTLFPLALLCAVMLLPAFAPAASHDRYYVKRVNGGTAVVKVKPGLLQRVRALPSDMLNDAVSMTEPQNSRFYPTPITQRDMVRGHGSYTLIDRTMNLTVNSVQTVSCFGGYVMQKGITTSKRCMKILSPY